MDIFIFLRSLTIAVLFAAPLALLYRRLKRGDVHASANAWKIFAVLTGIIVVRLYAIAE